MNAKRTQTKVGRENDAGTYSWVFFFQNFENMLGTCGNSVTPEGFVVQCTEIGDLSLKTSCPGVLHEKRAALTFGDILRLSRGDREASVDGQMLPDL